MVERYRDSAALLEHTQNLGDLMGRVIAICTTAGEVLGEPSPELAQGLASCGVPVYRPWMKLRAIADHRDVVDLL